MAFEDIEGWMFRTRKAARQAQFKKCNLDQIRGNGAISTPKVEDLIKR